MNSLHKTLFHYAYSGNPHIEAACSSTTYQPAHGKQKTNGEIRRCRGNGTITQPAHTSPHQRGCPRISSERTLCSHVFLHHHNAPFASGHRHGATSLCCALSRAQHAFASGTHILVPAPMTSKNQPQAEAMALCEQIHTVDVSRLRKPLGPLSRNRMYDIDQAIALTLSIGRNPDSYILFKKWEKYIQLHGIDMAGEIQALAGHTTRQRVEALSRALALPPNHSSPTTAASRKDSCSPDRDSTRDDSTIHNPPCRPRRPRQRHRCPHCRVLRRRHHQRLAIQRPGHLPLYASGYFACYTDLAIEHGYVWTTGDATGALVTMPYQAWELAGQNADLKMRMIEATGPYFDQIIILDAALTSLHPTSIDHLYFAFIAVAPEHHSKGIGSQLLQEMFDLADRLQLPIYGEASCERNSRLYTRLGMPKCGEPLTLPGAATPIFPLWRWPTTARSVPLLEE